MGNIFQVSYASILIWFLSREVDTFGMNVHFIAWDLITHNKMKVMVSDLDLYRGISFDKKKWKCQENYK